MPESTRHRQAFAHYWGLGPGRSLEALHEMLASGGTAPHLRTLAEWSRSFHWQARVADIETQARRNDDEARVAALVEMADRHAKEALLLQQVGTGWLTTLSPNQVSADAAIRAVVEGVRLERLVRGEPTERAAVQSDSGLERISDDQLSALVDLAERALAREEPASS